MPATENLLNHLIAKQSFLNNYPHEGVVFLAMDALFNDPHSRKMLAASVLEKTNQLNFDCVAGVASRGYIFSGLIANQDAETGEQFVQKVKVKGDNNFIQLATNTEYSSDALQVLKGTVQKNKNYLLADDLIATGGSLTSAIELIRQSGGEVTQAFVMAELIDFGAREVLKKIGVELISLFKFTQQDLQKILSLQAAYANTASIAIPYQLSQHKGELPAALTLLVASKSSIKKTAAINAYQKIFNPLTTAVKDFDARSDVSNQPFGLAETERGCLNRLAALNKEKKNPNEILIAMENGLRYAAEEDTYYDFVKVAVEKDNVITTYMKDCCVVPKEIVDELDPDHRITWGEIAKQKGMATSANNPHQESIFGGISREKHLTMALEQAFKKLLLAQHTTLTASRFAKLKTQQAQQRYAKRGILFSTPIVKANSPVVNLYNQGFAEKALSNSFQIFDTGDAFSVVKPCVTLNGAMVNIHVGVQHPKYSSLVLLHEALELCRCASEHGAKDITIALPEAFHPLLRTNDFNVLLINLFKVSGASRLYFYDKNYQGEINEKITPLTYDKSEIADYLNWHDECSLDEKIKHHMRKHAIQRILSQCDIQTDDVKLLLDQDGAPKNIEVPTQLKPQHILLYCAANQPFALAMAEKLRARGEVIQLFRVEGNGENVEIPKEANICGATVTIVQATRPNPDNLAEAIEYKMNGASTYLFESLMLARQAHLCGAEKINFINPYQFSARSDKAENNTKGKTGAYVQLNGLLLEAAGVNQVITAECHDPHTLSGSYCGKKISGASVAGINLIAIKIAEQWLSTSPKGQLRLVAPDAGAAKRTSELTKTLQAVLKDKLCDARILGEKERGSHKDDSAVMTNLNSGNIAINVEDKYLITDDETATGGTLCQAIQNLKKQGAEDISVAIVHNNMPLDWLARQLSLARFLFLGVKDLHFSNTQEMGTLATGYEHLIHHYAQMTNQSPAAIESEVKQWFETNLKTFSYEEFKQVLSEIPKRVIVHDLTDAFADKLIPKPQVSFTRVYTANTLFARNKTMERQQPLPIACSAMP